MKLKYFKEHLEQPTSFPMNKADVENRCLFYDIQNYSINDDLTIDIHGDFDHSGDGVVDVFFVKFNKVEGSFDVSGNYLKTLEGWFPKEVGEFIEVSKNNLTDLKGSPKISNGSFYCQDNELTTLKGCPEEIRGTFDVSYNELESFEHCAKLVTGYFLAESNYIKNLKHLPSEISRLDLRFNHIENLEGCPDVSRKINIQNCRLTSLKGLKSTSGELVVVASNNYIESMGDISDVKLESLELKTNRLTTLNGCPKNIKCLSVDNNSLTDLEGCPESLDKLEASDNNLKSLKGCPNTINMSADFSYNYITNLEGCPTEKKGTRVYISYNPIYDLYKFENIEELNILKSLKVIKGNDVNIKRLKYFYSIMNLNLGEYQLSTKIKKIKQYYNII